MRLSAREIVVAGFEIHALVIRGSSTLRRLRIVECQEGASDDSNGMGHAKSARSVSEFPAKF